MKKNKIQLCSTRVLRMMMASTSNMMSNHTFEATGAGVELNWSHYRSPCMDVIVSSYTFTEAINRGRRITVFLKNLSHGSVLLLKHALGQSRSALNNIRYLV